MQYEKNTHKIHRDEHEWIYTQWNGPSVTKTRPENCKNCSSKCAYYDCPQLHYTIQHKYTCSGKSILSIRDLRYRSYTHTHLYPKILPPSPPISTKLSIYWWKVPRLNKAGVLISIGLIIEACMQVCTYEVSGWQILKMWHISHVRLCSRGNSI